MSEITAVTNADGRLEVFAYSSEDESEPVRDIQQTTCRRWLVSTMGLP